jgi:hypothetical protein
MVVGMRELQMRILSQVRHTGCAFAVLIAVLVIAPGWAQAEIDPQLRIDAGRALFEEERYTEALEAFKEAFRVTHDDAILYLIGRCYELLEEHELAISAYESFLASGRAPGEIEGRVIQTIERLREEIADFPLTVHVAPFGADVFVDGEWVGRAPLAARRLRAGRYRIMAEHSDFGAKEVFVDVGRGGETDVVVDLTTLPPKRPPEPEPVLEAEPPEIFEEPLPPPPEPRGRRFTAVSSVLLGVGLGMVGGGGLLFGLGENDHQKIKDGVQSGMSMRTAVALEKEGWDKKYAGYGLFAAGGAAVVTSVVLFLVGRPERTPRVSMMPYADPNHVGFSFAGQF